MQVFSRSILKAGQLSIQLDAIGYTNALEAIMPNADLYIIAVHDDAICEVANSFVKNGIWNKPVVHTSGATPMRIFKECASQLVKCGVFYPLQTFSKNRQPDFSQIPICIDAESDETLVILENLAQKISPKVIRVNDQQRATLHLAAVFVNNFTNHLFHLGESILKEGNLSFELLLPLIHETIAKLEVGPPALMQTGPAIRHDELTIQRHLSQLEKHPQWHEIYQLLTKSIQATA